jgi:hypothetical protein
LSKLSLRWLYSPPVRLRALSDRSASLLRILWLLLFLSSAAIVALGTAQELRDAYELRPAFKALGLSYSVEDHGDISVEFEPSATGSPRIPGIYRIVAIDGSPVSRDVRTVELGRRLRDAHGPIVSLDLANADGKLINVRQRRDNTPMDAAAKRSVNLSVSARLATGLLACGALLACSFLLARRRPNDPVALLFAFAFAGMAATIDPPLKMWMAMGWPIAYDIISGSWFYLLLVALAVFPDGVFVPKPLRWLLLAGIPLAIATNLPTIGVISAFVGLAALLMILAGQVVRYRRLSPGIERQQIKWAAFGFAVGLLLVLAAFVLLLFLPDNPARQSVLLPLMTVTLFSLGMAAIPFGLLIALTRFRLWEADTVITRSAAYAVVTLVVGVVWAASSDLVKLVIEQVIGRQSQAGATTVGAIIAAGIFSPTQSLVLGWTRKRFGGPVDRMRDAAKRLKSWGLTETPGEVATRALAIIDDVMHPSASAIMLDAALSRELVAARNVTSPDDPELVEHLTLADEEGSVGTLLLGRRSDRNRYNRQQLEAIEVLIAPLAEALRVARSHFSRESMMQQRLDEMAARLAQLEGGAPKPA